MYLKEQVYNVNKKLSNKTSSGEFYLNLTFNLQIIYIDYPRGFFIVRLVYLKCIESIKSLNNENIT